MLPQDQCTQAGRSRDLNISARSSIDLLVASVNYTASILPSFPLTFRFLITITKMVGELEKFRNKAIIFKC